MSSTPASRQGPPADSLIEYPCAFPIKVMGANVNGFVHAMTHIAERFDPTFDTSTIEQLDELYRTLTSHPMVKVVL